MAEQPPQRTRLTKSKATSSTTAIQTLEITTTAIVTSVNDKHTIGSPTDNNDNTTRDNTKEITRDINKDTHVNDTDNTLDNNNTDLYRKQSHHHHRHHIRSPGFEAGSTLPSPLTSQNNEHLLPADISLPPPIVKGPSEAIVALQDAANDLSNKKSIKRCPPDLALFDSSFFSAALLIQWSNLMGPKVERVWSVEPLEERVQMLIGRQVLNGEMGRSIKEVEPKWIILHKQGIICTAFLYNDPTIQSLCAFVLVVPIRYLKNFSQYFNVLCDRVPYQLVEVLIKLRMIHRKCSISWPNTLNFFTLNRLMPFVKSIMDLESVSLPAECIKTNHTILDQESRQMLESPFIAKVITSHLQTYGSSLLVGNTLTTMNMVINTLALFLTPEERSRSSHARKHHHYMPDLYIQGMLIKDVEEMDSKLELAVLDSIVPTTLIDMTGLVVRRTPLYNEYDQLKAEYHSTMLLKLDDSLMSYMNDPNRNMADLQDWSKRQNVLQRSECIAPMVQTLLDETCTIPTRMREAYVKHWRRCLVRRSMAMIKFVQDETPVILCQPNDNDLVTRIMNALALYNMADFIIVLTQAEKLRPGMAEFVRNCSKRL